MITPRQDLYYTLTYHQLDTLIQQHFQQPRFDYVIAYEWSNDSDHTGEVRISDIEEDGLDYEDLQEFLRDPGEPQRWPHWTTLLAELAQRGEVPEGNYIIEVCW